MILQRPASKQSIEGYRQLVDEMNFDWIPIYLKRQKIKSEIREYQKELKNLHALDPVNEDVKNNALADLPVFRKEIIKRLASYLNNNRRPANPLSSRLDRLLEFVPALFIDENMIADAVALMPKTEGCMPIQEKRKKISSVEKKLEKLKGELGKSSPPEHFQWINGQPTLDFCENYELRWRSMQSKLNAPCCALGFDLKFCKESEQAVWRELGIRSAMSPNSRNSPIPG